MLAASSHLIASMPILDATSWSGCAYGDVRPVPIGLGYRGTFAPPSVGMLAINMVGAEAVHIRFIMSCILNLTSVWFPRLPPLYRMHRTLKSLRICYLLHHGPELQQKAQSGYSKINTPSNWYLSTHWLVRKLLSKSLSQSLSKSPHSASLLLERERNTSI